MSGQHQIEYDNVVLVVAGEFESFFAGIDVVHDRAAGLQHEGDASCRSDIVFHKQDTHDRGSPVQHVISTTIACNDP